MLLSLNVGLAPISCLAQPDKPAGVAAAEVKSTTDANADLTIDQIMEKALTAYGGRDAIQQIVNGANFFGKQMAPGSQPLAYRHVRKDKRWRTDVELAVPSKPPSATPAENGSAPGATSPPEASSETETSAFDGVAGWHSTGKDVLDMPGDRLAFLNDQEQRQPWLLAHWHDPDYNFELKGRTTYKQIPVYAIDVSEKGGSPTTLYLDQNNYLVVAVTYQTEIPETESAQKGPAKLVSVGVDYSEYRPTGGAMMPFKLTRSINGSEVESVELTSANTSTGIDDSVFYRPSPGTAWRLPKSVTIPFDYSQKEIVIKGRLNGSDELDFILDTGASETIIDRRVAAEQFLAKQGQYNIAGVAGYVATQTSMIKRLELGNLILNDVQARILDLSGQGRVLGHPIAGIIGTNVISKFVTVIDYGKPSITIGDIDNYPRPAKASQVAFAQKQAPFVKVTLGSNDEQVLLVDTGAAFNHIPTDVALRYLKGDPANLHHVTEGTGLDGRPVKLGKVVIDTVSIGGMPVRKVAFTYPWRPDLLKPIAKAASEISQRSGFFQDSRLGILGNPFWENFIVTIDYKYHRLLLQLNPIVKLRNEIGVCLNAGDNELVLHYDYRAAELNYQKALVLADSANDAKDQAVLLGRLGNLRRVMAKDLSRPEHAKAAYDYFVRAQAMASKLHASDVEGRILGDWSLLYSDNGQAAEAKQTIDQALLLAPEDPNVNVDCAVQLYRAHMYSDMQKYVEKALFLEPSNWQALWYQVKLSELFSDTPKVVATLKEILRFYPWSKVAIGKLKSLNMNVPGEPTEPEPGASSQTQPVKQKPTTEK